MNEYNVLADPQMYLTVGILMLFIFLIFGVAIFISARRRNMKAVEYLEWERLRLIQSRCPHMHWIEFEDDKIECNQCKKTAFLTKKKPNDTIYH